MFVRQRVFWTFILCAIGSLAGGESLFAAATTQPLAFPGAEGFAARVTGGRGGEVYHVSNLNDSGAGSLRDAVSKGPRVVVFDVGGYINLKSALAFGSDLTVAGQTAPGEGIATYGYEISLSNSHNLIIRGMRFRQGITVDTQQKKSAINMVSARDVILDHDSVEWGRWDTIDMNLCTNVTVQYCIVGQGVDPQRFGCLCQSDNITFSHNLWINNQSRNPKAKGIVQYINNVVYNWAVCGYVGGHSGADHEADLINNYFIAGPDSGKDFVGEFAPTDHIYQSGNYIDANKNGVLDGRLAVPDDFGKGTTAATLVKEATVHSPVPVTVDSAQAALEKVLTSAGCSMHRDAIDVSLVAQVRSYGKEGKIVHNPTEIGGEGQLKGGTPPTSSAGDGIADAWKVDHHMKPKTKADPAARDADGQSLIEQYVNSLIPSPESTPGAKTAPATK
jgi:pectate lyase